MSSPRRAAWRTRALAGLLAALPFAASAGRPLATDDAAVIDRGRCEVESWFERAPGERARVVSAGCGVFEGLQVAVDATRLTPRNSHVARSGGGLKWAPSGAALDTPLGELKLGLGTGFNTVRPVAGGWHLSGLGASGIASLHAAPQLALHLNLGPQRDKASHQLRTLLKLAAAWAPSERLMAFAEVAASDRPTVDGRAIRSTGARWWVMEETLALDLTASRVAGSHGTLWSVGFGWYGLGG